MPTTKTLLRRDGFTFKQFFVAHDRCAMKVGTDGILLGAWAPVAGVKRILDIGTGSGLIALMLAQRANEALIDAVEMDPDAASQAAENAQASPWAGRIHIHQADFLTWTPDASHRYDLIVSNPPFYDKGVECGSSQRELARYNTSLEHEALLRCAAQLITEEGCFCVVLPEATGSAFTQKAQEMGWHIRLRTDVCDNDTRLPHRVLLAFSPTPGELFIDRLAIRGPDQRYSDAWCGLTQDFYLFM